MLRLCLLLIVVLCAHCDREAPPGRETAQTVPIGQGWGSTPIPALPAPRYRVRSNSCRSRGAPGLRDQWWYFTGNLRTDDDARFGYRLAVSHRPRARRGGADDSDWRTSQIYMRPSGDQ